ncbi:hypothetical protein ABS71_08820 [bacterium SCN 62-11]|nr:fused MFS/spermidine synthase [Candidatus Eremiobacteraeota bacterium]ODT69854.1 MAG: hypothetical protein ABS71_08820 [bacterium SCN 62-11]
MNRFYLYAFAILSGLAALSWEVLWQMKATLALGISALGTAITLATTMGGMSLGSILTTLLLSRRQRLNPLKVYAALELVIGISGLLLGPGFAYLEALDVRFYHLSPQLAPWLNGLGIALVLGPPSAAMGATIPIYGLLGRRYRAQISMLYSLNTAGAAVGCLLLAFVTVPQIGIQASIWLVAAANFLISLTAVMLSSQGEMPLEQRGPDLEDRLLPQEMVIALLTGVATFSLEIAWFRCLRGAFSATTESFAIMLTAVLVALALGARFARRRPPLGPVLCAAGVAILVATPLVERFDIWDTPQLYWPGVARRLLMCVVVLGPPMALLGTALPTLLEGRGNLKVWARLYSLNTLGAIFGSLLAAWLLLPGLGFVTTAWIIGLLVGSLGVAVWKRPLALLAVLAGWAVAAYFQTGIGTLRLPTRTPLEGKIVKFYEGPDCQTVVWERPNGERNLFIDGFCAAHEGWTAHYMAWMGRAPMLLHPDPKTALVICFGTGQTINAVRQEGAEWMDVVDVNPRVLQSAGLFPVNQKVLEDPRVHPVIMDGRAWLRRTDRRYDVITLEPMPPTFAGVNALYTREFYQLVASRLKPGGITAQWLPLHLQRPPISISMAATFRSVFRDSIVWSDPNGDRLMIGRLATGGPPLGQEWPGLARQSAGRNMSPEAIRQAAWMDNGALDRYTTYGDGKLVTDDNQLLAYGASQQHFKDDVDLSAYLMDVAFNVGVLQRAQQQAAGLQPLSGLIAQMLAQLESGRRPDAWPGLKAARASLSGPLRDTLDRLRMN